MMHMVRRVVSRIELEIPGERQSPLSVFNRDEGNQPDMENLDKINHDIRGSINIIIGYTQLMLDQTTGKINAHQRRALEDILNSGNRLQKSMDTVFKRLGTESQK